ncbi:MAG: hypothetical protein R3C05_25945 [Pirellulaceae bacterium]
MRDALQIATEIRSAMSQIDSHRGNRSTTGTSFNHAAIRNNDGTDVISAALTLIQTRDVPRWVVYELWCIITSGQCRNSTPVFLEQQVKTWTAGESPTLLHVICVVQR